MSPSRRVRLSTHGLMLLALVAAAPAAAQFYEDARRELDLAPDPLARSPRLLGMGRLTLVVDDPHNRITLWDFAGNPTGIMDRDSVSTVEIRPATSAASSIHDLVGDAAGRERQDRAAREIRIGFETWHRKPGSSAYGILGNFGTLRFDRPIGRSTERRSLFSQPSAMIVLNGPMPLVMSDRMRYALRLLSSYGTSRDRFLAIVVNGQGEYVDQDGQLGDPPDFFTPDRYTVRTVGGGAAVSYRFGDWLTAAIGADGLGNLIKGDNTGRRYVSEIREHRPLAQGQASLIGRIGGDLEWGVDARGWTSSSNENWRFTLSTGTAQIPVSGRGNLGERKEEGSLTRSRARWSQGPFEIGAGFQTSYREVQIIAPEASDLSSFNRFRNRLFHLAGSDTLVLPDSVVSDRSQERGWEFGSGIAWRLREGRGVVGVEFHSDRMLLGGDLSGRGPQRVGWDLRSGLEYALVPGLQVRGGHIYRQEDQDEYTEQNEFLVHTLTLGLGYGLPSTRWSVDLGYAVEWRQADFGDPGLPRESRQRLAFQTRWWF